MAPTLSGSALEKRQYCGSGWYWEYVPRRDLFPPPSILTHAQLLQPRLLPQRHLEQLGPLGRPRRDHRLLPLHRLPILVCPPFPPLFLTISPNPSNTPQLRPVAPPPPRRPRARLRHRLARREAQRLPDEWLLREPAAVPGPVRRAGPALQPAGPAAAAPAVHGQHVQPERRLLRPAERHRAAAAAARVSAAEGRGRGRVRAAHGAAAGEGGWDY